MIAAAAKPEPMPAPPAAGPGSKASCARIVPQPSDRANPVPLAAMVDLKMHEDIRDGYRDARMPRMQEAWRRGLVAIDPEAKVAHGAPFHVLPLDRQDDLLAAMQKGELRHEA